MSEAYSYDVFVSYSHRDEEWVTGTLLPRLEEKNLRVCIDYRDFAPGKASLLNMQDAAKTSRHTLLVLTPRWIESEWSLYESILSASSDPAGLRQQTIPLMVESCDLSAHDFIANLSWVDFTRPDREAIAWGQLLTALGRSPAETIAQPPTARSWFLKHPYGMPPNFTGRDEERAMLGRWLDADGHPLLVLRALGGFGKSALVWHWITHDLDPKRWPRLAWWGLYDDRSFENLLAEVLGYLGVSTENLGPSGQVDALVEALREPGTLLILDGFERALRAYGSMDAAYQGDAASSERGPHRDAGSDCISPLAESLLLRIATLPEVHGRVLLTTRLRPRILETRAGELLRGCREEELDQLRHDDAVAYFQARGVRGARSEIESACAPYGYHPLSLCLLAGMITRDLRQPGDVAVAKRLDVSGDLVQRKTHVLQTAYDSLAPTTRRLLSRIACFRGTADLDAIQAVAEDHDTLERRLGDLLARGLIHRSRQQASPAATGAPEAGEVTFDLHPIVRRYAYDRMAQGDRASAHGRLRSYFADVETPEKIERLEDLEPVIELYHHTIKAGQYEEARRIFHDRLDKPTYYQFGAYQLQIELLRELFADGEDKLPCVGVRYQGLLVNDLAAAYALTGQARLSIPLSRLAVDLAQETGLKPSTATGLGNLAILQAEVGQLRSAVENFEKRIEVARELPKSVALKSEAIALQELGRTLGYCGKWSVSRDTLDRAMALFEESLDPQGPCIVASYRVEIGLLSARASSLPVEHASKVLVPASRRALQMVDDCERAVRQRNARDYLRARWMHGAASRASQDLSTAERYLLEAVSLCRTINMVDSEAAILLDLARLRRDQQDLDESLRLAGDALLVAERCGYVLHAADAHLLLAELAARGCTLERLRSDGEAAPEEVALEHARRALDLSTCDGEPFSYKVAFDEAQALIEALEAAS